MSLTGFEKMRRMRARAVTQCQRAPATFAVTQLRGDPCLGEWVGPAHAEAM
jgi:hypothetical protein